MTNEMHNSYNQFLFHSFLSALHVSNKSIVHHQEHGIIYCITQFGTIVLSGESSCWQLDSPDSTIVPIVLRNTVYYAVLLMMNY